MIVGGTDGLGLSIARRMVRLGARNLILTSRNAERKVGSAGLRELERLGCTVALRNCDINSSSEVKALAERCAREMPPIQGVIQTAMKLTKGLFLPISLVSGPI